MSAPWIGNEPGDWDSNWSPAAETYGQDTSRIRSGIENDGGTSRVSDSPLLPARTSGGIAWRFRSNSAWANALQHFRWLNAAGTEVLRVANTASGTQQLQFWNGSSWTGVGAAQAITTDLSLIAELSFAGLGTSSGDLALRYYPTSGGAAVAEWVGSGLGLTAATDIAKARLVAQSGGLFGVGEYIVSDDSPVGLIGYNRVGNANGTDTDGGAFGSIDDTTINDADFLSLASSGNRHSVKGTARNFAGRRVDAVSVTFRGRRGASGPTQVKVYLLISGTRYYHPDTITLSTSFSAYFVSWEDNPATSAPWLNADAENANLEWGWEAV